MKKWLEEAQESLQQALDRANKDSMSLQDMYRLAPSIFADRQKVDDESLIREMGEQNEQQVQKDWSYDEQSREQFRFHFVSSYLFCFVVAGKIDEFKYDRIMEYVNGEMDLFSDGYGLE